MTGFTPALLQEIFRADRRAEQRNRQSGTSPQSGEKMDRTAMNHVEADSVCDL